jgi:hypothetical protein
MIDLKDTTWHSSWNQDEKEKLMAAQRSTIVLPDYNYFMLSAVRESGLLDLKKYEGMTWDVGPWAKAVEISPSSPDPKRVLVHEAHHVASLIMIQIGQRERALECEAYLTEYIYDFLQENIL